MPTGVTEFPLAFDVLIERLRLGGFTIGTGDYLRLHKLLERVSGECGPGEVKTILAPIFARSPKQQQLFYDIFEDFWAKASLSGPAESGSTDVVAAGHAEPAAQRKLPIWRLSTKAGAAIIAALVLLGFVVGRSLQTERPVAPPPVQESKQPSPPATPAVTRVTATAIEPPSGFRELLRQLAMLGTAAPVVWLVCFLLLRRLRARVAARAVQKYEPPYWWPIRPMASSLKLYRAERFYAAARKLRLRVASGRHTLDLPATIAATVKQRGYPTFRYRALTRPADYLCLIRRNSPEDHRASLFDALIASLAADDVGVHRYFFDAAVALCSDAAGRRTWTFAELKQTLPTAAVLVFGDLSDLFHPFTGHMASWALPSESDPMRALFTYSPPTPRQVRDAINAGTGIFPATLDGLIAFAELTAAGGLPTVESVRSGTFPGMAAIPETREEARAWLGPDVYALLCACAVYRTLDWDLTLYLGGAVLGSRSLLTERTLIALTQLPWFQAGGLPSALRAELVEDLGPDQTDGLQRALVDLLERHSPPAASFAAAGRALQIAIYHARNSRRPGVARRLLGTLRLLPLERVVLDTTLLRFLDLKGSTGQSSALPGPLRERVYRRGIPGLGWSTATMCFGAAAVATIAMATYLAVPPSPPAPIALVGTVKDRTGRPIQPLEVRVAARLAALPSFAWNPSDGAFELRLQPVQKGLLSVDFHGADGSVFPIPGINPDTRLNPINVVLSGPIPPAPPVAEMPPDPPSEESAAAFVNRAIAAFRKGDYESAVKHYDRALLLDPGNGRTLDLKAYSLFKLGRYRQARALLEQALRSGFSYARLDLVRVECAAGAFAAASAQLGQLAKTNLIQTALKDGELMSLCEPIDNEIKALANSLEIRVRLSSKEWSQSGQVVAAAIAVTNQGRAIVEKVSVSVAKTDLAVGRDSWLVPGVPPGDTKLIDVTFTLSEKVWPPPLSVPKGKRLCLDFEARMEGQILATTRSCLEGQASRGSS